MQLKWIIWTLVLILEGCDSSPHCKITINLKTNYSRSLRWFYLLDAFRTLTKEELHAIFKRHIKVGLQCLSGCCCIIEDTHFSIKALKWQELFGLKRTPVVQSDSSAPVREDTVTAEHEVPKGDSSQRSGSFSFLILGKCNVVFPKHIFKTQSRPFSSQCTNYTVLWLIIWLHF